jgi:16S rRNA processing protein RimM
VEALDKFAQFVHVGTLTKPHGIRGDLKIISFSGEPENFQGYPELIVVDEQEQMSEYSVLKCRSQGRFAVVSLKGVTTRNQSEALTGRQVWVAESYLPDLDASEFYWRDAMGKDVTGLDGQHIGTLVNLFDAGGQDMMVVQTDDGEVLIPGQSEFVVEINEFGVVVDLPPGLLEVNVKE